MLFMILGGFVQAKASKLGVLPVIVHRAPRQRSSLLLFAMLSGFLEADNSPSFVRRLVVLSFRQDRGFDPSGSHQLPIVGSDGDQCPLTLHTWHIFFEIIYSFGGSRVLDCDW